MSRAAGLTRTGAGSSSAGPRSPSRARDPPSVRCVAEFSPFRGVRYDCARLGTDLDRLVAPPYDVIDDDHRAAFESQHDANAVHLILPQDHTSPGDRYQRAAIALEAWQAEGVLRRDPADRFYGYRMDFEDAEGRRRHTIGVLGALRLPAAVGEGGILPHERTLPKAKTDRLDLLRATRANLDPIWGLSAAAGLTALIDLSAEIGDCTDDAGVRHRLCAIDDPDRIAAIRAAIGAHPLVLADGHHRFETAVAYRDERRAAWHDDHECERILCLVVELTESELCIEPIHRLVTLGDLDVAGALELFADAFEFVAAGANSVEGREHIESAMAAHDGIGVATEHELFVAVPRPSVCRPALVAAEPAEVRGTDAALVEAVIVPRLTGAVWRYRHDLREVAALVEKREASLAFLLRPVSVETTKTAAAAGVRMPQKTTFFSPKPRTGMVYRLLD